PPRPAPPVPRRAPTAPPPGLCSPPIRRAPTPPRSPYTTLFRSRLRVDHVLLRQHARGQRRLVVVGAHRHRGLDHDRSIVELGGQDRKSTRLHSSHVKISHAVVCVEERIAAVRRGAPESRIIVDA